MCCNLITNRNSQNIVFFLFSNSLKTYKSDALDLEAKIAFFGSRIRHVCSIWVRPLSFLVPKPNMTMLTTTTTTKMATPTITTTISIKMLHYCLFYRSQLRGWHTLWHCHITCRLRGFNPLATRNLSTATCLCCEATKYESYEPIPSFLGGQEPLLGSYWSLLRKSAMQLNLNLLSLTLHQIKLNHPEPEKNNFLGFYLTMDKGQVGHKPL